MGSLWSLSQMSCHRHNLSRRFRPTGDSRHHNPRDCSLSRLDDDGNMDLGGAVVDIFPIEQHDNPRFVSHSPLSALGIVAQELPRTLVGPRSAHRPVVAPLG
jgi:hypothetical protein